MPSGRVHVAATVALATMMAATTPSDWRVPLAAGALMGIPMSPDLDLQTRTISEKIPIVGPIWQAIWYPYALAVKHRSWVSHMPLISTVFRLAYLVLMLWALWALGQVAFGWQAPTLFEMADWLLAQRWFLAAFIGLALSDALHALMDQLF